MARTRSVAPLKRAQFDDGEAHVVQLLSLVNRIRRSVAGGSEQVWGEAERSLSELSGAVVEIYANAAGSWFRWSELETPHLGSFAEEAAKNPPDGLLDKQKGLEISIREGSIVARLALPFVGERLRTGLEVLASAIDMAIIACDNRDRLEQSVGQLDVMRTVATRILETQDLDELLLLVSHETKRMLASDICGVMLREGNEVVMRSCVGQLSADTARLRMEAGVGVAGQVLEHGLPCMIPNYVESEAITRDFFPLARVEKVRSALAVPLVSRNSTVGVLEVWRRRPSTFSEDDQSLLQSLAGLASIAIDNAMLTASRERAAAELNIAHRELAERFLTLSQAAAFQDEVARLFLERDPLRLVAERTADFSQGSIYVLDRMLEVESFHLEERLNHDQTLAQMRQILRSATQISDEPLSGKLGDHDYIAQKIAAGSDNLGWIIWIGTVKSDKRASLTLGHVALAISMHLVERRRIARDRNETLQSVLWDLLDGSDSVRAAAIDRARDLNVSLKGEMIVIIISLGEFAARKGGGKPDSELRDDVLDLIRFSDCGRMASLIGIRGEQVRLICKATNRKKAVAGLETVLDSLRRKFPFPQAVAGLSSISDDIQALASARREALVALEVARYRHGSPIAHYDEAGVLGLLINLRDKHDMRRISEKILNQLVHEAEPSRTTLIQTLSTFFSCDCSQLETSRKLRVHQKTVAYRIGKISRLTGLDFSRHNDRVLADVAVRIFQLVQG